MKSVKANRALQKRNDGAFDRDKFGANTQGNRQPVGRDLAKGEPAYRSVYGEAPEASRTYLIVATIVFVVLLTGIIIYAP